MFPGFSFFLSVRPPSDADARVLNAASLFTIAGSLICVGAPPVPLSKVDALTVLFFKIPYIFVISLELISLHYILIHNHIYIIYKIIYNIIYNILYNII